MRLSLFLFVTFYLAMVLAALAVEGWLFSAFGWIPLVRNANIGHAAFSLNYTTILNILSLALAGWLHLRYRRTGGPEMMSSMKVPDGEKHQHQHKEDG